MGVGVSVLRRLGIGPFSLGTSPPKGTSSSSSSGGSYDSPKGPQGLQEGEWYLLTGTIFSGNRTAPSHS